MTRIGYVKCVLEIFFITLVSYCFSLTSEDRIKMIILYVMMQFLVGRFRGKALLFYDEIRLLIMSHTGFFIGCFLIYHAESINLFLILKTVFITMVLFFISGSIARYSNRYLRKYFKKNTMIVGIGDTANALKNVCHSNRYSMLDVLCAIDCNQSEYLDSSQEHILNDVPVYRVEEIEKVIFQYDIDTLMVAIPQMKSEDLKRLLARVSNQVEYIKYLPQVPGTITFDTKVEDFDGLLMISNSSGTIKIPSYICKRLLDIAGGLVGCLLLIPVTIFVWLYNRSEEDKGPIFFTQDRIGKDGKIFKIYKFRTMVLNAEQILDELMEKDPKIKEEYTLNKKLENDPRITKAGKILRSKSIDEVPQFINVLLGQMSLIGPRPYLPREKEDMGQYYSSIIHCTPGLTGMWQTHGRSDVSFKYRLELDDYYYKNWSFWLDITLFFKTIKQVIYGNGAM